MKLWLTTIVVSMLTVQTPAQGFPSPVVEIAEVVRVELAPTLLALGTVVSRNDARIAAEVAGRITWIAEPGEYFAAGDAVAMQPSQHLLEPSFQSVMRFRAVWSCGLCFQNRRRWLVQLFALLSPPHSRRCFSPYLAMRW